MDSQMAKDINMFESILRRNFFIKKHWRNGAGVSKVLFNKRASNDNSLFE